MIRALSVLLLFAATALAQGRSAAEEVDRGRRLFDEGKFGEAETHFRRVRMLAPRAWQGHAYHALTLVQQAAREKDATRKAGLLREASRVSAALVKEADLGFTDPLYRFVQALIESVRGNDVAAHAAFRGLMKVPQSKYAPYAEMPLLPNVQQAYAQVSVAMANRLIILGAFQDCDDLLDDVAPYVPDEGRTRLNYERQAAVVDEHLGRLDDALAHLGRCLAIEKDEERRHELRATMAMMLIQNKRLDDGKKLLAELPADSTDAEVLGARCMLRYELARRDPQGEAMREALALYRKVLAQVPPEESYLLVEQYTDLVLAKVDRRTAKDARPLLEHAVEVARKQIAVRPECPRLYYAVYRLYRLLGDAEKEVAYQRLHEQKKAEWGSKAQYDERGRPRCR